MGFRAPLRLHRLDDLRALIGRAARFRHGDYALAAGTAHLLAGALVAHRELLLALRTRDDHVGSRLFLLDDPDVLELQRIAVPLQPQHAGGPFGFAASAAGDAGD